VAEEMTTTIWERVKTALTSLNLPMAESAYIINTSVEIPDTYLVYFAFSIDPAQHADDQEVERIEAVQVSIYKRAGFYSLPDVIGAMKTAGFTFIGGRELEYDLETRHFGLAFDFEYQENI
jgi:hypothetical protein